MIFSRSDNKWYLGEIEDINGQLKDEWLTVRYDNNKKTKKIQRASKDIEPIYDTKINHPSLFKPNTKCKILSDDKTGSWCSGEIIDVFNDTEGEWLKVKYFEDNVYKICDIQRYSKQIKPDINMNIISHLLSIVGLKNKHTHMPPHSRETRSLRSLSSSCPAHSNKNTP